MSKYRILVSIDGENFFWVVVDKERFIRNPTTEDRIGTKLIYYNPTNVCSRCRKENNVTDKSILYPRKAYREYSNKGNWTERWLCSSCWNKIRYIRGETVVNIEKLLKDCRTGNLDPNCTTAKAIKSQKLACKLYEWKNLNEESDNHCSPLDCYDPKTGLYHQVQMRHYISERGYWPFNGFADEWKKIFEDMVCFCISEDGKIVERIYKFPWKEIIERTGATVYKNPIDKWHNPVTPGWYVEYIKTNEDELKNANDIWKTLEENK